MATRSRIGIELENGKVKSIYCHWDGYPSGVGAILKEHYSDRQKLESLLELGDISALDVFVDPDPTKEHSFLNPQPGVTLAYGRDRGESNTQAQICSVKEFRKLSKKCWAEYGYVYKLDGTWKTYRF